MTVTEIINELIETNNLSKVNLATELGIEKNNLSNKLKRDNFSIIEVLEIADVFGLELVLRKKTQKTKANEYIIDYSGELKGQPKRKPSEPKVKELNKKKRELMNAIENSGKEIDAVIELVNDNSKG